MENSSLLWLFIVFFMIHEFEEMIYLPHFLDKNKAYLKNKLPNRIYSFLKAHLEMTREQFVFAVFEEFICLSLFITLCVTTSNYSLFVALTIAYVIHIFVHIAQSIYIKKYLPAVASGIISSIYCVISILILNGQSLIYWKSVAIFLPFLIILILLNLKLANYLGRKLLDFN